MKYLHILLVALCGILLSKDIWVGNCPAADPKSVAADRRPNIVYILADDWGWGDLSCHGNSYLKTPNLDALARSGTDFQQFNVLNPVCSPSRTASLTGQFPARYCIHQHFASVAQNHHRGMPDWLDPKAPTIAKMLKAAGYHTGHFGKWHLTSEMVPGAPPPTQYGFDEFKGFNYSENNVGVHDTADNAIAFIKENKDRPFYVDVWIHESHTPHMPTKESMALWSKLGEREQVYAAVITDGDNAVGKVLGAIKELGLEQNTLVVFSSDNGPEWTHGPQSKKLGDGYGTYYSVGQTAGLRGRKRSLFEGGVRVPFFVRWPGHTPAGVINKTTVLTAVDLLPTFCQAAGVPLPQGYAPDGQSMLTAFEGHPIPRTKLIYWEWTGISKEPDWWPRLAVREGDWKLLLSGSRMELHQIPNDWSESSDVAKQHPDIVQRLAKLVTAWKASLPKNPSPDCISKDLGTGRKAIESD